MRKTVIFINVILVAFHFFTESHALVSTIDYNFGEREYDLFLSSGYERQLPVKWYLKMNFDSALVLVILFLWHRTSLYQSKRLFFTLAVWVLYHMADLFLFWWNYKSSWATYWIMLAATCSIVFIILMPLKEKAKVVSMD